jgi:glycosyltransferase 2 family protein
MSKRILLLVIGIIISVVALYYAFRDIDFGDVWEAFLRVRIEYVLLLVIPYILTFMTKVWRWRSLFHPDEERARTGTLFSALMISYIPLPFRAGEVARAVVTRARTGIALPRIFSTIVVEKVLDVLTLLLLLGASLPFVALPDDLRGAAMLVGIAVAVLALVLLALVLRPEWARRVSRFFSRFLPAGLRPRVESMTEGVLQGIAPLSRPAIAVWLGLWSLATWAINGVAVYLMLLAFNISVTPLAAVVIVVVTNLSMVVPAAPGYVGTFEAAVIAVLVILGIDKDQAGSFALFYHVAGLLPVALLGVIAALQQGLGMAVFRGDAEKPDATTGVPAPPPRGTQPTAVTAPTPGGREEP